MTTPRKLSPEELAVMAGAWECTDVKGIILAHIAALEAEAKETDALLRECQEFADYASISHDLTVAERADQLLAKLAAHLEGK